MEERTSGDMFLKPGSRCCYVPEYMARAALKCEVIERMQSANAQTEVFSIANQGKPDVVLGKAFFSEVNLRGLRAPDRIVPVRIFMKQGSWLAKEPKFGVDVLENGFLCVEDALIEYFPQLAR